ncbi:MAG: hypothetical protein K2M47_05400 [Clostridiales bacterium]|nr:hypothetical protein [Clostridiales bacterium]
MAQSIEQRLLQAIKNDDLKAFDALGKTARIGAYRLGRFPVLSLLYLYKSRKILAAHELEFLKINSYEKIDKCSVSGKKHAQAVKSMSARFSDGVDRISPPAEIEKINGYEKKTEPLELSVKFSSVAGKCLRLYYNEVVSPLEMLLILDKTKRLTRVFSYADTTKEIRARLQSIYSIKYALNVRFEGENIIIDKRPLSYREKKKILTVCLCSALGVAVAVCVPTITVALMPVRVEGEVNKLSDINFAAHKEYVLKRDIVLNKAVDEVNCTIRGNGHKLIFDNGAAFATLNGALTDMTIESSGGALFYTVSNSARVTDVTINVEGYVLSNESTALVAVVNYGEFDGVTVNVRAIADAENPNDGTTAELTFGGIAMNNGAIFNNKTQEVDFGVIKNSTVNYFQLELSGEASANTAFGGIAGFNNGYLQDCTVTGEIIANTVDVAGVCVVNNGEIIGCVNNADIAQTSGNENWNPIACGIVMTNSYLVNNCENTGNISAVSTCETESENARSAIAAGIAYVNSNANIVPYIVNCANTGDVESSAVGGNSYAAGVCMSSSGGIEQCTNSGAISAESGNGYETLVGGIADYAYGYIYKSTNSGAVSAVGSGTSYAGGISAFARAQILNCVSSGDIKVTAKEVCAGGIMGVSEIVNNGKGTAEYCISENRLDVTAVSDGKAYVGGIIGYVSEHQFQVVGGGTAYFGGGVTDSCFVGTCVGSEIYFGNIVGVCGANIYYSNSYYSSNVEYHNFDGNYYVNNSFSAFGATASTNESDSTLTAAVEDKGATSMSIEDVKKTVTYKKILSELENV